MFRTEGCTYFTKKLFFWHTPVEITQTEETNMTKEERKNIIESYISCGTITLYDVMESGEDIMNEILKRVHPYQITHNKTRDRYETYIKQGDKRKKIVRKTMKDMEELLLEHYKVAPTFESLYDDFIAYKKEERAGGTIEEYAKAYKDYYEGDPITERPLEAITQGEMKAWLIGNIKKKNLGKSGYDKMNVVFSQLYRYANDERGIKNNPFDRIHIGSVSSLLRATVPNDTAYTTEEAHVIIELCRQRRNIYDFVFPFVFYTGIRRGEIIAAKWQDVKDGVFYVQRREECYQESDGRTLGKTVKKLTDRTKGSAGWRPIELIPEAVELLDELKHWQAERGIESEFVFAGENGNASIDGIEDHLGDICDELKYERKSVHKIRRTHASVMLDAGMDPEAVRKEMGHVDITTTMRSYWKGVNGDDRNFELKCKALKF